ncbi:5172_t:CDS:2, partial [Cetraspora pellucida]
IDDRIIDEYKQTRIKENLQEKIAWWHRRRARENFATTSECDNNTRKHTKLDNTIYAQYEQHNLGRMNIECVHCNALHWLDERLTSSSRNSPKFGTCCSHGQVILPFLQDPPILLRQLFECQDDLSKEFPHAFTSLGAKIDQSVFNGHGPYSFRISGELYHRVGSLLPDSDAEATYAQLYIYDLEIAHQLRMEQNESLSPNIMWKVQELLHLKVYLHFNKQTDQHCYSLPTANEIAIILPGNPSIPETMRDIILRLRGGPLQRIHEGHLAYLPIYYVLFFPYGELGWHPDLRHTPINMQGQSPKNQSNIPCLTQLEFYTFRLFSCKFSLIR